MSAWSAGGSDRGDLPAAAPGDPHEQFVTEIARTYPSGVPRDGQGFVDDPAATLAVLVTQMRALWDAVLAPWWPRISAPREPLAKDAPSPWPITRCGRRGGGWWVGGRWRARPACGQRTSADGRTRVQQLFGDGLHARHGDALALLHGQGMVGVFQLDGRPHPDRLGVDVK